MTNFYYNLAKYKFYEPTVENDGNTVTLPGKWKKPDWAYNGIKLIPEKDDNPPIGFFPSDQDVSSKEEVIASFGDGTKLNNFQMDSNNCENWQNALGLSQSPSTGFLIDVLEQTLTEFADPDGINFVPPLNPTQAGNIEIHLGGHSLVKSRKFQGENDPAWPSIKEFKKRNYEYIRTSGDKLINTFEFKGNTLKPKQKEKIKNHQVEVARKWLWTESNKLGVEHNKLRFDERLEDGAPLNPTTTITDDFSGDLSNWTEIGGPWSINSSSELRLDEGSSNSTSHLVHNTDLSSSDHSSEIYVVDLNGPQEGTSISGLCRADRSASQGSHSGYFSSVVSDQGIYEWNLEVINDGSTTELGISSLGRSAGEESTIKVEVDGSTITLYSDDNEELSLTDSTLSSSVQVGVHGKADSLGGVYVEGDDFSATDGQDITITGSATIDGQQATINAHEAPDACWESFSISDWDSLTASDWALFGVDECATATAPVLSNATGTGTSATTADGSVETDTADSGTLYWVITTSQTSPTTAQIQNGQNHEGDTAPDSGNIDLSSN